MAEAIFVGAVVEVFPIAKKAAEDSAEETTEDFPSIRLAHDLLNPRRYDASVRPVRDYRRPVNVTLRMNLYQILDVTWKDEFLGWEPENYDGISMIVFPYDKIWLPDTYLYNRIFSLEMSRDSTERWISVILTPILPSAYNTPNGTSTASNGTSSASNGTSAASNGTSIRQTGNAFPVAEVRFQYPAIYTFSCKMYILYFPFDMQNCTMIFGSWTYDSAGIDFYAKNDRVLNESYVAHEEWNVVSFLIKREVIQYACCPIPYVLIRMELVLQRKSLYYMANLIIPVSIITLIAVIGFFMPATTTGDRTEKVNLGITTLLAMSILLLMVSDQIPTTSDFVPLIGWYFLTIMVLTSVGTAVSSFVILLQQQGRYGRRIPVCVRTVFFRCFAPCLLMKPPAGLRLDDADSIPRKGFDRRQDHVDLIPDQANDELLKGEDSGVTQPNGISALGLAETLPPTLLRELQLIRRQITDIQSVADGKEKDESLMLQWEYLASILDRILLVLFVLGVFLVTFSFTFIGLYSDQFYFLQHS